MSNRFDELPTEIKKLLVIYGVFIAIAGLALLVLEALV